MLLNILICTKDYATYSTFTKYIKSIKGKYRMSLDKDAILASLRVLENTSNKLSMSRFGINTNTALGISIPEIRKMAKAYLNNHDIALELWSSNIHEARLLACFIDNPSKITEKQMENWVKDFDSWDICDQVCVLFAKTPFAFNKAMEWVKRETEFERRAGFVLMAALAVHDKKMKDACFIEFFPIIENYAFDERNFVKKAINWALRQIGKRNLSLNKKAIELALILKNQSIKTARWIGSDALRELQSDKIQLKLKCKI